MRVGSAGTRHSDSQKTLRGYLLLGGSNRPGARPRKTRARLVALFSSSLDISDGTELTPAHRLTTHSLTQSTVDSDSQNSGVGMFCKYL